MTVKNGVLTFLIVSLCFGQMGMGRNPAHYDQDAIAAEKQEKALRKAEKQRNASGNPATRMASGVKDVAVDSPTGLISETRDSTTDGDLPPVLGTLEGARRGSGTVLDKTVKGAFKVATLGFGEVNEYDVREPETHSGESTKITIKIPGT